MKKICMILVLCLMATFAYGQTQIDIMAKGQDEDIGGYLNPDPLHSAETLIVGKIQFDEVSKLPISGDVEFHMTINDVVTGEKVYSIKGHLKNGMVVPPGYMDSYCEVRNVTWVDFWFVMGMGLVKTTEPITIDYRGVTITLPDTEGKYVPKLIVMVVSPEGKYVVDGVEGYWGGWSWAGIFDPTTMTRIFGGITYLTKFVAN